MRSKDYARRSRVNGGDLNAEEEEYRHLPQEPIQVETQTRSPSPAPTYRTLDPACPTGNASEQNEQRPPSPTPSYAPSYRTLDPNLTANRPEPNHGLSALTKEERSAVLRARLFGFSRRRQWMTSAEAFTPKKDFLTRLSPSDVPEAFMMAIEAGSTLSMSVLVDQAGMDPTRLIHYNGVYQTPLHLAASIHSLEAVTFLIEREASLSARDYAGNTPLHSAVGSAEGACKTLELLLQNGADLEALNNNQETALGRAVRYRCSKVGAYLLKAGSCFAPNLSSDNNTNPFLQAVALQAWDMAADMLDSNEGAVARHWQTVQSASLPASQLSSSAKVVRDLLMGELQSAYVETYKASHPPNTSRRRRASQERFANSCLFGMPLLHHFAHFHAETAPLRSREAEGYSPSLTLPGAAQLLLLGADPNTTCEDVGTALHTAAESGDLDLARMLVGYGARRDAMDRVGHWPWNLVDRENHALTRLLNPFQPRAVSKIVNLGSFFQRAGTKKGGASRIQILEKISEAPSLPGKVDMPACCDHYPERKQSTETTQQTESKS